MVEVYGEVMRIDGWEAEVMSVVDSDLSCRSLVAEFKLKLRCNVDKSRAMSRSYQYVDKWISTTIFNPISTPLTPDDIQSSRSRLFVLLFQISSL